MSARMITLDADEANAVVYAVALEITNEAEILEGAPVSTTAGDLLGIAKHAARIARLADIGEQLEWRAHWGPLGGEPPAISVPEAVVLDLAAILHKREDEQARYPDDEAFEFGRAARKLAGVFATGTR